MIKTHRCFGIHVVILLFAVLLINGPSVQAQELSRRDYAVNQTSHLTSAQVPETSQPQEAPTTIAPPPDPPGSFEETVETTQPPVVETTTPTRPETTEVTEEVTTTTYITPVPTRPIKKPIYSGFSNQVLPVFQTKGAAKRPEKSYPFEEFIKQALTKSNLLKQGDFIFFMGHHLFQSGVEFNSPNSLPYPIKVVDWTTRTTYKVVEFFIK